MALRTPTLQVSIQLPVRNQPSDGELGMCAVWQHWWPLLRSARYKEHEDGFLRLQLIRYESVELTEQLMRERQSSQAEEEEEDGSGQIEFECPGAAPAELQVELRGVLLEEQRTEEPTASVDVASQVTLYVLTGGSSQEGD